MTSGLHPFPCREVQCSMDSLKFACSWRGNIQGAKVPLKIGGLQLEGCTFDGLRLAENQRDSPIVSAVPPCVVAWIPKVRQKPHLSSVCHGLDGSYTLQEHEVLTGTCHLLMVAEYTRALQCQ